MNQMNYLNKYFTSQILKWNNSYMPEVGAGMVKNISFWILCVFWSGEGYKKYTGAYLVFLSTTIKYILAK